jgi:hypothetical protein
MITISGSDMSDKLDKIKMGVGRMSNTIEDYDWTEYSMDTDDLIGETDIYSDSEVDKLEDDDEISMLEAGFMKGYNQPAYEQEL